MTPLIKINYLHATYMLILPSLSEVATRLLEAERGSGGGGGGEEEGVEGDVVEEADLDADGDDLAEVCGTVEVFAAGTHLGEGEVAGAGEFEAGGDDGGVEIDGGAELDFDAELHGGGREGAAVEDPATTVCKGSGKRGENACALFVTEALDVKRLHVEWPPVVWILNSQWSFEVFWIFGAWFRIGPR